MDQEKAQSLNEKLEELQPVRFDIKALLILTLVCAVAVVLVDRTNLLGTVTLFIASVIAGFWLQGRTQAGTRRFWLQAIWGIMMPLACLVTDPFVFGSHGVLLEDEFWGDPFSLRTIRPASAAVYGFIVWQMIMLMASWFVTTENSAVAAFLAGSLLAGVLFAGLIGMLLVVPAIVFSLFLLGLPGFTPLITMRVFHSAYKYCRQVASKSDEASSRMSLGALGFVLAVLVWFVVYASWPLIVSAAES